MSNETACHIQELAARKIDSVNASAINICTHRQASLQQKMWSINNPNINDDHIGTYYLITIFKPIPNSEILYAVLFNISPKTSVCGIEPN